MMYRLARAALAGGVLVIALASPAQADDEWYGRLFYTPAQRAALEDARRRNIRSEELAVEAAKRPAAPRSRNVTLTGIVQRSDGESFAWVNGKPVDSQGRDGLRVRHFAGPSGAVVYDPQKGRAVSVKVGQRVDWLTGRVEEAYERKGPVSAAPAQSAPGNAPVAPEPPRKERSEAKVEQEPEEQDDDNAADGKS